MEGRSVTPSAAPLSWAPVEEWEASWPWLLAGTTERRPGLEEPNFGLFTDLPASLAMASWEGLLARSGAPSAVHGRQVHGCRVRIHGDMAPGLHVVGPGDGHATRAPGVLLTVTTADCVPVSIVDPERRALGLLHAGWRGVGAGVLEEGMATMARAFGTEPAGVHVHLGPAICGACYEVGGEVFRALGLAEGRYLDLRAVLRDRCLHLGVDASHVSVSGDCTRCGPRPFFSHRGGDRGRQVAFLMIRPTEGVGTLAP